MKKDKSTNLGKMQTREQSKKALKTIEDMILEGQVLAHSKQPVIDLQPGEEPSTEAVMSVSELMRNVLNIAAAPTMDDRQYNYFIQTLNDINKGISKEVSTDPSRLRDMIYNVDLLERELPKRSGYAKIKRIFEEKAALFRNTLKNYSTDRPESYMESREQELLDLQKRIAENTRQRFNPEHPLTDMETLNAFVKVLQRKRAVTALDIVRIHQLLNNTPFDMRQSKEFQTSITELKNLMTSKTAAGTKKKKEYISSMEYINETISSLASDEEVKSLDNDLKEATEAINATLKQKKLNQARIEKIRKVLDMNDKSPELVESVQDLIYRLEDESIKRGKLGKKTVDEFISSLRDAFNISSYKTGYDSDDLQSFTSEHDAVQNTDDEQEGSGLSREEAVRYVSKLNRRLNVFFENLKLDKDETYVRYNDRELEKFREAIDDMMHDGVDTQSLERVLNNITMNQYGNGHPGTHDGTQFVRRLLLLMASGLASIVSLYAAFGYIRGYYNTETLFETVSATVNSAKESRAISISNPPTELTSKIAHLETELKSSMMTIEQITRKHEEGLNQIHQLSEAFGTKSSEVEEYKLQLKEKDRQSASILAEKQYATYSAIALLITTIMLLIRGSRNPTNNRPSGSNSRGDPPDDAPDGNTAQRANSNDLSSLDNGIEYSRLNEEVPVFVGKGMDQSGPTRRLTEMLQRYGKFRITNMTLCREKVLGFVNTLYTKILPYEKLFHLSIIVTVMMPDGGHKQLKLDKQSYVNIDDKYTLNRDVETLPVSPPFPYTLDECFEKMLIVYGRDAVWTYRAFSNNCQTFAMMMMAIQNKITSTIKEFVLQDKVQNYKNPFVIKFSNIVTQLHGKLMGDMLGGSVTHKPSTEFASAISGKSYNERRKEYLDLEYAMRNVRL